MSRRALVLGGGGTVGIAWELGVLAGLARAGMPVDEADLIVGTSAGSVVGTQLALGMDVAALLAAQLEAPSHAEAQPAPIDAQIFGAVVQLLGQAPEAGPELLAEVGRLALVAATPGEPAYLQRFGLLAGLPWPARELLVTGVEVESGAFRAWGRDDGAPLQLAVAASCAVPGIFPPVTIDGRRYMDGGMRSDTNADLAAQAERVLVVAPIGPGGPALLAAQPPVLREIAQLRAAGKRVELIAPDEAALEAFGPNLMDGGRRVGAAEAGLRQGQASAAVVAAIWQG